MIRIGCSGWNYRSWREVFYPPRLPASRWLEHYASVFDTVEVNTTFYRLARRPAVERWVAQTPADFCFAVKASRYLTHMKRFTDLDQGVARLYEPLEPLIAAGKLGPMLWQLPPNFRRDDDRLAAALDACRRDATRSSFAIRRGSATRSTSCCAGTAWRWRSPTGPDLDFQLHTRSRPTSRSFAFTTARRGRRGNYSASELREWAARLARWGASVDVYAYFNNDWEAFAPRNALALRRMVAAEAPASPPAAASRPPAPSWPPARSRST